MASKPNIVAFFHTYARDGELDPFMNALAQAFVDIGVCLHLIVTNDLVENLAAKKLRRGVSDKNLVGYINEVNPTFIFTTNRGGITRGIMRESRCPLITWMVDHAPFLHHGGGHEDLFCERDHVITSVFDNVANIQRIYPILSGRVHFLPFATNVADFQGAPFRAQDINVSFIGTYFYCNQITRILNVYKEAPNIVRNILDLARRIEENYYLDILELIEELGLQPILRDFRIDAYTLKMYLSNAISLNNRVRYLDTIADLGLQLYGTENWTNVGEYSLRLLRCYRFGEFIKTRQQLVSLYQRSKISLNISHNQAVDGLPYRVFDIMASRSMLITEYKANSDLFRLFGSDMPIPMYRDEQELRELTRYYLAHDKERQEIVRKCNELVGKDFSFEDRVREIFRISETIPASDNSGEVVRVTPRMLKASRWPVRRAISRWVRNLPIMVRLKQSNLFKALRKSVSRLIKPFEDAILWGIEKTARIRTKSTNFLRRVAMPIVYGIIAGMRRLVVSCIHIIFARTTPLQRTRIKQTASTFLPLSVRTKIRDFVEPGRRVNSAIEQKLVEARCDARQTDESTLDQQIKRERDGLLAKQNDLQAYANKLLANRDALWIERDTLQAEKRKLEAVVHQRDLLDRQREILLNELSAGMFRMFKTFPTDRD